MDNYTGKMSNFINEHYEKRRYLDELSLDEFNQIVKPERSIFQKSVLSSKFVFGNNAFREIVKTEEGTPRERFAYGKFDKFVFDIQMLGFAQTDTPPDTVRRYANQIREAYEKMVINVPSYAPISENDNSGTADRIKHWQEIVHHIVSQ